MDTVGVLHIAGGFLIHFVNSPFSVQSSRIAFIVHLFLNVDILVLCQTHFHISLSTRAAVKMLGASFLPARLRHEHDQPAPSNPGYLNRQITQVLQSVALAAFTHPMYTIFTVAILASTSYHGLLEGSFFGHTNPGKDATGTDLTSLVEAGRRLRLGEETAWKWKSDNGASGDQTSVGQACNDVNWTFLINR